MFKVKNKGVKINILILCLLLLKGFNAYMNWEDNISLELSSNYNTWFSAKAYVCEREEIRSDARLLVLCLGEEKILIYTPLYPEYSYGDILEVSGRLQEAPEFIEFNYRKYLALKNISASMYYPSIEKLGEYRANKFFSILKSLDNLSKKVKSIVVKNLPEPEAGLALAVLLGEKKSLFERERENFSDAGVSHLIVISGVHVSMLSALIFFSFILLGLSKRISSFITLIFLSIYPFFIGLSLSAVRASIMTFMVFLAFLSSRLIKSSYSLLISMNIILIFNPALIYYDVGFQLSFVAVFSIIYLYPLLWSLGNKLIGKRKNVFKKYLFQAFFISLACQLALFPIIAYHFKSFSLLSIFGTLLLGGLLGPLITCLYLAVLLAFIFPSFQLVYFYSAFLILKIYIESAAYLASFQNLILEFNSFSLGAVFIYYLCLFLLSYILKVRFRRKELKKL